MPSEPRPEARRSDFTLLLGATIGVLIGGIVIAAAILAVTSRGPGPNIKRPLPYGLATDIHEKLRKGGPIFIAGPSGDNGFWVAIEDDELVALIVRQPKPVDCTVRWRGSIDTFTCDDRPVDSANLARFRSYTAKKGSLKGSYMVALRDIEPPPAGPTSSGG